MTRDEIRAERERLWTQLHTLQMECQHPEFDTEEQEAVYDWRSDLWYDCYCSDCCHTWSVYKEDKDFNKVKDKYEREQTNLS